MFVFLTVLFLLIGPSQIVAQDEYLESFHAEYDDVLHSWDLYTNDREGSLEMTWVNRQDLSEWNYDFGDNSGIIRTIWPNSFDKWELKSYEGNNIQFSIKWRGDKTEWMVTDGDIRLTYRTVNGGDLNAWEVLEKKKVGSFVAYTEFDDDPRDWLVEDYLSEDLPIEFSIVFSFIPIFVIMSL